MLLPPFKWSTRQHRCLRFRSLDPAVCTGARTRSLASLNAAFSGFTPSLCNT